jgi:hypothetical protein
VKGLLRRLLGQGHDTCHVTAAFPSVDLTVRRRNGQLPVDDWEVVDFTVQRRGGQWVNLEHP